MTLVTNATQNAVQDVVTLQYFGLIMYHFLSGAFCYTLSGIKAQFNIRKEEPTALARRATYDKKTLARLVIPLAPGYRQHFRHALANRKFAH